MEGYEMRGKPLNLYYDSGTTVSTLNKNTALELGFSYSGDTSSIESLGERHIPLYFFTNHYIDPYFYLFPCAIAEEILYDMVEEDVDGIVGHTPFLEKYLLEIDFENNQLCFRDTMPLFYTTNSQVKAAVLVRPDYGTEKKYSNYYSKDFFSIRGSYTIADSIIYTTFVLDTGCHSYSFANMFEESLFEKAIEYKKEKSAMYGDSYPTSRLTIPELGVDSLFTNMRVKKTFDKKAIHKQYFGNKSVGGYLGIDFFLQYKKILFDWKNKIAYFYKES
ncbi:MULTISPECIES: hypothetical protein [unclassified Dysgonomonas]|uniref:hypothetical protein n=1 Tax=unclassified Dysgonomonas TaxID=2630389 RepID=UPI0024767E21|nr:MULTISPECIES: hypothetical protein [unclassified Dysgonomonas]